MELLRIPLKISSKPRNVEIEWQTYMSKTPMNTIYPE